MRFSRWITRATNRHPEHIMLNTFPRQQWLGKRASVRSYMHLGCLVTYKEWYGFWFYNFRFYMSFTSLRHTCHGNTFVLCTESGIAQSLQLLGYVLCKVSIPFGHDTLFTQSPDRYWGAFFLGVKRAELEA